jgi:ABC-type Fe3+-hydroxamate transport system substrate-binding protein
MKTTSRRFFHALWLLTLAIGLLQAPPFDAQEASGPRRIISLVPAVTEMLFAIGAGGRVIAVSSFDRFPPEVATLPRVGALIDPDTERILSLRPDLVAIYHTQQDVRAQLARAQVPVFVYEHAGLADVTATLRQVGQRVGAPGPAAKLASSIEARIDAVRKRSRGRARPRTLVIMGRDPFVLRGMYASGGTGFVHDMVTAAGGDNVFADVDREAVQATTELVITRRPDVILELRAEPPDDAIRNRELAAWNALTSVPAVRARRVHIIGDARTIIPGPRVAEGVELLERVLHDAP